MQELQEARYRLREEIEEREMHLRGYCSSIREGFSPARIVETIITRMELVISYVNTIRMVYRKIREMFKPEQKNGDPV